MPRLPYATSGSAFRRGFTLIEILTVCVIIVTLVGILIPTISVVMRKARIAKVTAQLHSLQTGLQGYYNDFHMYPPSAPPLGGAIAANRGSAMLAQGLMGYLPGIYDGAGPSLVGGVPVAAYANDPPLYGFRTTPNGLGNIYGPYASPEPQNYKVLSPTDQVFIDVNGHEILYYHAQPPPKTSNGMIIPINLYFGNAGSTSYFSLTDNNSPTTPTHPDFQAPTVAFYQKISETATNNTVSGGAITGANSYLLISAGEDGIYFTDDDIVVGGN